MICTASAVEMPAHHGMSLLVEAPIEADGENDTEKGLIRYRLTFRNPRTTTGGLVEGESSGGN